MKVGFLSVCVMLFSLYGTESLAYFAEKKSQKVMAPPLTPITSKTETFKEDKKSTYVIKRRSLMDDRSFIEYIKHGSLRDKRSFADVVKGVKKSDTLDDKKEFKKEKKQQRRQDRILQPNSDSRKYIHDDWRAKKNEMSEVSRSLRSAKEGVGKRKQSAHKGNLHRSR